MLAIIYIISGVFALIMNGDVRSSRLRFGSVGLLTYFAVGRGGGGRCSRISMTTVTTWRARRLTGGSSGGAASSGSCSPTSSSSSSTSTCRSIRVVTTTVGRAS